MKIKMIKKIQKLFLFVLSVNLMSCGDSIESSAPGISSKNVFSVKNVLSLDDVHSASGCLSIPLYADGVHSLNPELSVLNVSTQFRIDSKDQIREEFRALTAYSTFQFSNTSITDLNEFDGYSQDACNSLTYKSADGSMDILKITAATADSLTAESDSGKKVRFHWLSPQSVEIEVRYELFDAPCTSTDAFVDFTKIIDWSGLNIEEIDQNKSKFSINDNYLELVAKVLNYNVSDLYEEIPSPDPAQPTKRVLLADKVKQMLQLPVQSNFLACSIAP